MAKKRATKAVRLLKDATSAELAIIASALVRELPSDILRGGTLIPTSARAACGMLSYRSFEEVGDLPLEAFLKEAQTAKRRERWIDMLEESGYRIDVPAEAPLKIGPSAKELARVKRAIDEAGKTASYDRILATLRSQHDEGKGMRRQTLLACLAHFAKLGKYTGHKRGG